MNVEPAPRQPWVLTPADLDAIALGAGVLGSGGGGPAELAKLLVLEALRHTDPITIVPMESQEDTPLVVAVAQVGTPMVFSERLGRGTEPSRAVQALEAHLGARAGALMCDELGGLNSMMPLLAAAHLRLPVLDADAMGRAFPDLYMDTLSIYAEEPVPCAFCDDEGNIAILPGARDLKPTERLGRAITIAMGGMSYLARPAPFGEARRQAIIPGSYSRAWAIGRAVRRGADGQDLPALDLRALGGRVLFHGLVTAVNRRSARGPLHGTVTIEGYAGRYTGTLRLDFQNEYLSAHLDAALVAVTPDVISLIDDETGEPVGADQARAGHHVVVLGFQADRRMTTPEALAVVGPAAFGYPLAYRALALG
ncbi:MAG TPA: DUF917 domain-containing protein [Chloroflexota bacterium]|nr:DUF917 domain-containing protein [Chloroflexota bacterium]